MFLMIHLINGKYQMEYNNICRFYSKNIFDYIFFSYGFLFYYL